jgi:hypothetical protein
VSPERCDRYLAGFPVDQEVPQPRLHRRTNGIDVGKRQLALEAGGDIGREANPRPEGPKRPLFDPGADDQQPSEIWDTPILGIAALRSRYRFWRSSTSA